jgi:hypothetical protein
LVSAGEDFIGVSAAAIAVNSSPFTYTYILLDDQVVELNETFDLVLAVGAEVEASIAQGSGVATILISDDDGRYSVCRGEWDNDITPFRV